MSEPSLSKIDVLVRSGALSTTKFEHLNSEVEVNAGFLLIKTSEKNGLTTKVYNLSEVYAFKQYYKITTE